MSEHIQATRDATFERDVLHQSIPVLGTTGPIGAGRAR